MVVVGVVAKCLLIIGLVVGLAPQNPENHKSVIFEGQIAQGCAGAGVYAWVYAWVYASAWAWAWVCAGACVLNNALESPSTRPSVCDNRLSTAAISSRTSFISV